MDEFDKIRAFSNDLTKKPAEDAEEELDALSEEEIPEDEDASLYGFKSKADEEIDDTSLDEIEDKEFSTMKIHVVAIAIFAVVLAAVLVGFFALRKSDEPTQVVTVQPTSTPVKVRPADAGGMKIPDQDKLVYSRIKTNKVDTKVESLFPEPERPLAPKIILPTQEEIYTPMNETAKQDPLTVEPKSIMPKRESVALPKTVVQAPVVSSTMPDNTVAAPEPKVVVSRQVTPTTGKVAVTGKVDSSAVSKRSVGGWSAQLMSSPNKASVEKSWPEIQARHKSLLSNMSYAVVKADIPGKGTYYRLRVGSFGTKEQAEALCKKLKAQKQDCVPAK